MTKKKQNNNIKMVSKTKDNQNITKEVILICGMHRSGTSLLSRTFSKIGYYPGGNLLPENEGNIEGYFEDENIVNFNDEILRSYDSFWNDPFSIIKLRNIKNSNKEIYDKYILKANHLVNQIYKGKNKIIIKDPRISLLMDFWNSTLAVNKITPKFIACYRNVEDVLRSLYFRDHTKLKSNFYSWINYNFAIIEYSLKNKIYICQYNDLSANYEAEIKNIKKELGLGFDEKKIPTNTGSGLNYDIEKVSFSDQENVIINFISNYMENYNSYSNSDMKLVLAEYKKIKNEFDKFLHEKFSDFELLASPYDANKRIFYAKEKLIKENIFHKHIDDLNEKITEIKKSQEKQENQLLNFYSHLDSENLFENINNLHNDLNHFYTINDIKLSAFENHLKKTEKETQHRLENYQYKYEQIIDILEKQHDLILNSRLSYKIKKLSDRITIFRWIKIFIKLSFTAPLVLLSIIKHRLYPIFEKIPFFIPIWRSLKSTIKKIFYKKEKPAKIVSLEEARKLANKIKFNKNANPKISIIIPVFNNYIVTVNCLNSLCHADMIDECEIIIADDASIEKEISLLKKIKNIVFVQNQKNIGFLKNCNNAAKIAKGHYILFLNNDTVIGKDCLSHLYEEIIKDDKCAIVGPKILYPNGKLQEAGAKILPNGDTKMIGLNDDPDLPSYNYNRKVDYVSGACFLIKKEIFKKVNGFSTYLAPAYCEDVDLALKVRKLGYYSLYVHKAEIEHVLSATYAKDKKFNKLVQCRTNQAKLLDKWYDQIDEINKIKAICFYLPQFHTVKENDEWWGKGFTEWTNVKKTKSLFKGHEQPKVPIDGYYDLKNVEAMEAQAKLAKKYGVHGFCYYHYWFSGRRILEMPVNRIIETNRPDFPFCLCWANENWTRRWDGQDQEILLNQDYNMTNFEYEFIKDLKPALLHKNYIRIDGKPFLLIYRVNDIPNYKKFAERLRNEARKQNIGELYLGFCETFEMSHNMQDPKKIGFDVSVEFPPHAVYAPYTGNIEFKEKGFDGNVFDYRKTIDIKVDQLNKQNFKRIPSCMPGWDNSPRRGNKANIFYKSSPELFQKWLSKIVNHVNQFNYGEERMVFINAWNEWAEGAYLEMDNLNGCDNLQALKNSLDKEKIIK